MYEIETASRILRAMFEIALEVNVPEMARSCIQSAIRIEKRLSSKNEIIEQFVDYTNTNKGIDESFMNLLDTTITTSQLYEENRSELLVSLGRVSYVSFVNIYSLIIS
jgi:hypothetical protein